MTVAQEDEHACSSW